MMDIKPYNSKELADQYGVSYNVFLKWLNPIRNQLGEQIGRLWTNKQVQKIVDHLGRP